MAKPTIPQIYKWFTGTTPTSKVTVGALNVVGLFFAIVFGVAFLSATMTNFPNSTPFHTRIKQLLQRFSNGKSFTASKNY